MSIHKSSYLFVAWTGLLAYSITLYANGENDGIFTTTATAVIECEMYSRLMSLD